MPLIFVKSYPLQVSMEAGADVEDIITREDGVVEVVGFGSARHLQPFSAAGCEFDRERASATYCLAKRTGKR